MFKRIISLLVAASMLATGVPVALAEKEGNVNIKSETSDVGSAHLPDYYFSSESGEITPFGSGIVPLAAESSLSGRVVDQKNDGAGLSNVSVQIYNIDENEVVANVKTDGNGYWSSEGYDITEGYKYTIRYYEPQYMFEKNHIECVAQDGETKLEDAEALRWNVEFVCNEDDYDYIDAESGDGLRIEYYNGADPYILIPAEHDGSPVTEVGEYAFSEIPDINVVCIPENVTFIGDSAFEICEELKNVYFPNTLETIGYGAFFGCIALDSVDLPNSVSEIGSSAFQDCSGLSSINYPASLSVEAFDIFSGCSSLEEITVPEGVADIPSYVFSCNEGSYLNKINLPSTLVSIGERSFYGCTELTSIELPASVSTIGTAAFGKCTKVSEFVYLGEDLTFEEDSFGGPDELMGSEADTKTARIVSSNDLLIAKLRELQYEVTEEEPPAPTATPTVAPTATPTAAPTASPTASPTVAPTATPTVVPTATPTVAPTATPTVAPTATPTVVPTATPTVVPTATPTVVPTATPTVAPTATPTVAPTATPTAAPTATPTVAPTATPTVAPTATPTVAPTASPTASPMPVNEYTITYDYKTNGGSSVSTESKKQKEGEAPDLTPTAVKSGYEFVGWSLEQKSNQVLTDDDKVTVTGDMTLYAVFKTNRNVRFYSRNGRLQTTINVTVYNNETSFSIKDKYPEGVRQENYDGWTAAGWADSEASTTAVDMWDHDADSPIIPDVFKDYYSLYKREIILTYDAGEYGKTSDSQYRYFNVAGTYSECKFTFADIDDIAANAEVRDFEYWAIGDKKTGEAYKPGETIELTESATAYAVFTGDLAEIPNYKIICDYETNGGTSMTTPYPPSEIRSGEMFDTATLGDGVKTGWEFVGWNTDRNAKEGIKSVKVTGDITLYAIYKKEITATFTGGDPIKATLYNNTESAIITLPEPPESEGWESSWHDETNAEYKPGAIRISKDKTFSPFYKKFITLVYDTDGSADYIDSRSAYIYKNGANASVEPASFELASPPTRSGYTFKGWTVGTENYSAGDTIKLTESAVAKAQWQKDPEPEPEQVTVTYNALTNGGNISSPTATSHVTKGENADLSIEAVKVGYEFVGWNTDKNAHEALTSLAVTKDTTLYAIFKKDIKAVFHSGGEVSDGNNTTVTATLYNNDKTANITAPVPASIDDWSFDGWRKDKYTIASEYKNSTSTISSNTDFYAVYSREFDANGKEDTQYRNTGGGIESKTIVLDEPDNIYDSTKNERFAGWEVTIENEDGTETTMVYEAGAPITVSGKIKVQAKRVEIPEGATLPRVETVNASVSSETTATLTKTVKGDDVQGNEIIKQGFVYWSKLSGGTKYTVTSEDDTVDLSSLSPGTEYYYYAFAENAAGTGKGTIKKFTTESDTVPNAIMITPEYVSIEVGGMYQLLAVLLPDTAKNSGIVWSSNNSKIATVDQHGKVTGVSEGQAIITATTEVGRLTAECIVDVDPNMANLKPMDFSEWHMASHTSIYAEGDRGFDWDTADLDGGNHQIATAYLARWEGAVDEENDKYPKEYDGDTAKHYNNKINEGDYHVQNIEWLPVRTGPKDNDEIKSALMKYGAVYSLTCIDWDCFDKKEGYNYYCPRKINYGGHAVTIVGWDDNYPKTKFKTTPAGDGAFICKNSWGEWWGDDGYFYVSYYDALLGRMDSSAVVTGIENNTAYNKIYQYDPFGAVGYIGYEETTYAANVFPESGKTLTKDEKLHAVSFYTYQKNTSYDVYIVTDYEDESSLARLYTPSASGVIENAGYHTIDLKSPVTLESGTRFAVVVRFDTPGEYAYVYCEYPVDGYSSNARANEDESYYSYDGEDWRDLTYDVYNADFCIKAFTGDATGAQSIGLFSAIDNAGRSYENDKVYTLSEAVDMGMPISDEYIEYCENKEDGEDAIKMMSEEREAPKALGSTPGIVKAGSNSVTFTDGSLFPESYDLRDMGILSPVKDQGEWGTCWAHSMYASLESNILRKQKTTSSEHSENTFILSREGLTMSQGSAVTLAKRIKPADLTDKSVIWLSSNDDAVTVDTNGTVRAIGSGTATVSAALKHGGLVAQCSVVVENDDEIEETIEFEEKRIHKETDDVFMVAYSVTPAKSDSVYSWVSDNTNVATVNEAGVITTKAIGTAEISILSDGKIKDTVTVVVGDGLNMEMGSMNTDSLAFENGILRGNVKVSITNSATSAKYSSITLAVYDNKTGVMAGMVSVPKLLTSGENTVEFNDVSIDGISQDGYTLKCFVWNSFGNMSPLSKAAEESVAFE